MRGERILHANWEEEVGSTVCTDGDGLIDKKACLLVSTKG